MQLPPQLVVILLSLFPGIEIRGAIAYGKFAGLGMFWGAIVPLIVSVLIIPIVYIGAYLFLELLMQIRFIERYVNSTRKKVSKYVDKYGFLGLILFVAVPLPGTGLYTGSLGAILLGMNWKKAVPALYIGNILAFLILLTIFWGAI